MRLLNSALGVALVAASAPKLSSADVVLSEQIMSLTKESAILSSLAYQEPSALDDTGYESLQSFTAEPDQALVVHHGGYCYGVFRGTTGTTDDWRQNFRLGYEDICTAASDDEEDKECCSTRQGFYDAYTSDYQARFEDAMRECAAGCENEDECVILTGHSQGGAVAALAGVRLADLNPYVFTFGQPPTIDAPCDIITSERWYRYVNTKESEVGTIGISYDPVPFAPGLGTDLFGHFIILGPDPSAVAYVGLDSNEEFGPLNIAGAEAHSMVGDDEHPGYLDRIEALMAPGNYPIRTSGYAAPSFCTEDIECETGICEKESTFSYSQCKGTECEEDVDCDTNRCDSGLCLPKFGSCMECDEDSDCASDSCYLFRCANSKNLMDNNCRCTLDSDCASGRCEGFGVLGVCEAALGDGARCNEDSDCRSGDCSWWFRCRGDSLVGSSFATLGKSRLVGEYPQEDARTFNIAAFVTVSTIGILLFIGWKTFGQDSEGYEEIPDSN